MGFDSQTGALLLRAVCQVNDGESVAILEIEESRGLGKSDGWPHLLVGLGNYALAKCARRRKLIPLSTTTIARTTKTDRMRHGPKWRAGKIKLNFLWPTLAVANLKTGQMVPALATPNHKTNTKHAIQSRAVRHAICKRPSPGA